MTYEDYVNGVMERETCLRAMIAASLTQNSGDGWLLKAYHYMTSRDVGGDEAIEALSSVVDEVIARKHAKGSSNTQL
jgi:hypothetical protein